MGKLFRRAIGRAASGSRAAPPFETPPCRGHPPG